MPAPALQVMQAHAHLLLLAVTHSLQVCLHLALSCPVLHSFGHIPHLRACLLALASAAFCQLH